MGFDAGNNLIFLAAINNERFYRKTVFYERFLAIITKIRLD